MQLETDRTGDTVDRYGRWLRYVYLDYARTVQKRLEKWPNSEAGRCDADLRRGGLGSEFRQRAWMSSEAVFRGSWEKLELRRLKTSRERLRKDGPRCVEWFVGSGPQFEDPTT